MISILRHYGDIYFVSLKNNFVREFVYRSNFITAMVIDLVWYAIEFTLFSVIYANTSSLGGWSQNQVFFFLGFMFASDALFAAFFGNAFWRFSDLINKGELDVVLTKPVSPVFLILSRYFNLTSLINMLLGFGIMIRYAPLAGFEGGVHWVAVFVWLLVAVAIQVLARFAFSVGVFWTERSWALVRLYYQLFTFASKPDSIFPKPLRYITMTILPFALIGSVPARSLLFGLNHLDWILIAAATVFFAVFDVVLWRMGLRKYQSASS